LLSAEAVAVRMRGGRQKHLVVTCRRCGCIRRIPVIKMKALRRNSGG